MPINFISSVQATGTTSVTTGSITTTGGSLAVMVVEADDDTVTVSDNKGNAWTLIGSVFDTTFGGTFYTHLYYSPLTSVGTGHTFTVTNSTSIAYVRVSVFDGTKPVYPFGAYTATGESLQAGSITPSEANMLVIAACGTPSSPTIDSINEGFTFTHGVPNSYCGIAYQVQSAATARNPTWASPAYAGCFLATFKEQPNTSGFFQFFPY